MKKLHAIDFHQVQLAAHYEFFNFLIAFLAKAGEAVQKAVAPLIPDLKTGLAKEEAVLRWARRSEFAEQVIEAAREIDRVLVSINAVVQVGLHSIFTDVKEAATRVRIMLKHYGRVVRKNYDEKAGDLRAMLDDFAGPLAADATTLGLGSWVQALQTALNQFEDIRRQRVEEQVRKPRCTARTAQRNLDSVYRRMAYIINAGAVMGEATAEFTAFISHLNTHIDSLNATFHRPRHNLSQAGRALVEPIALQQRTGEPVTPIPVIYWLDGDKPPVRLVLGRDFFVTYRNNVNAGTAVVIIHGRGAYTGRTSIQFNIVD
jgi:hypothetical protein